MKPVRLCLLLLGALLCATAGAADDATASTRLPAAQARAATTPATGDPSSAQPPTDVNRELRTTEEDVKRLKERVFRSKATLELLKEIVIEGAGLGARVQLWHVNKMGPAYQMESVQYFLDGKSVFARSAGVDGNLDELRKVMIHEQTLPPGTHTLQVQMVLRGNGFGVFSYLRSYSFKVSSSYQFKVKDGEETSIRVVANERSGLTRSFVDRPGVSYEESVKDVRPDQPGADASTSRAGGSK